MVAVDVQDHQANNWNADVQVKAGVQRESLRVIDRNLTAQAAPAITDIHHDQIFVSDGIHWSPRGMGGGEPRDLLTSLVDG